MISFSGTGRVARLASAGGGEPTAMTVGVVGLGIRSGVIARNLADGELAAQGFHVTTAVIEA